MDNQPTLYPLPDPRPPVPVAEHRHGAKGRLMIGLVTGLILLGVGAFLARYTSVPNHYLTTEGKITSSVNQTAGQKSTYSAQYTAKNGQIYTYNGTTNKPIYYPGDPVKIAYNPNRPQTGAEQVSSNGVITVVGIALVILGGVVLVLCFGAFLRIQLA